MGTQAQTYDVSAYLLPLGALPNQAATSGVAITTGNVVDRSVQQYPYSAGLLVKVSYTAVSSAPTDTITVAATVLSSAVVGMTSPTTLVTASVVGFVKGDGTLRDFEVFIPVNFNAALEFVQMSSVKVTFAGAGTYTVPIVGAVFVSGGMPILPVTQYLKAGFVSYQT